ncbi:hypothetical protein QOT17_015608 [Balamuthia mandrillaris]
MDVKNKKSKMISPTAFEKCLECHQAALENAHIHNMEELEKAAMVLTLEEEEDEQKKAVFFSNKIDWLLQAINDLENGKFPLFSCPPVPTSSVVPPSVTSNPPLQRTQLLFIHLSSIYCSRGREQEVKLWKSGDEYSTLAGPLGH